MSSQSNEHILEEGFKLIDINKNKSTNLRKILSSNDCVKNDMIYLQILQYLAEFESDLEALKSLLNDLKKNNNKNIVNLNNFSPIKSENKDEIKPSKKFMEKTFSEDMFRNNDALNKCLHDHICHCHHHITCCCNERTKMNNILNMKKGNKLTYETNYNIKSDYLTDKSKLLNNNIVSDGETDITLNFDYDNYMNEKQPNINGSSIHNDNIKNKNLGRNKNNINQNRSQLSKSISHKEYRFNNLNEPYDINNNSYNNINNIPKNNITFGVTPQFAGINSYNSKNNKNNKRMQKVINIAFSDVNILNEFKRRLGINIGKKLLNQDIDEELLEKMENILGELNINNGKRGLSENNVKTKKFNQPADKRLLREMIKSKQYDYKEYPGGWNSTKDYFVNNGTPMESSDNK